MNQHRWRPLVVILGRLVVAVLAVAVATLIRWSLNPFIQERLFFFTYFGAIAFATWYGGVPSGILATVLSYLVVDYFFMVPQGSISLLEWDRTRANTLFSYVIVSVTILAFAHVLMRASDRAQRAAVIADQQRKLFEVTLASIGDAVISADRDGRIMFMNSVSEKLTGWQSDEARGAPLTTIFRIIDEVTRAPVENPSAAALRLGKIVGLPDNTILISRDGVERPIDDSAAPILNELGEVIGVVLVFRDTTQQRQANRVKQELASIVEHSEDAVVSKTMDGIITSWNSGAERLFGYTAQEAIGKPIQMIIPPDKQHELASIMSCLKADERLDHWDTVRVRKDGTRVDVSLRISPIKNSAGVVIGGSKVTRDITKRKRMEEGLGFLVRASRALAILADRESALQHIARLTIPFFADICVIHCLGANDDVEMVACAHQDPDKEQMIRDFLRQHPLRLGSDGFITRVLSEGEPRWVEEFTDEMISQFAPREEVANFARQLNPRSLICVPMRVRERTLGVMTFVASDSRRRYSSLDLEFAQDLAGRAAAAIENSELLQSLKEAARQKDDFLAMLAHELRNPLATIAYALNVVRLPADGSRDETIDVIDRQVNNLTRLIDDLMDVARISRDKIKLQLEPCDASVIARHAAESVQASMEQKRHEFIIDLAPEPMPLMADATRAEQIISNLLTNAAKYTPEGGSIQLSVRPEHGAAVFKVKDTGVGLAAEILPSVFDLFIQSDRSLDRSEGGLGIGLTIVRKLTELHGGSVSVASAGLGKGAEFTVRFPLSQAVEEARRPLVSAGNDGPLKRRVLVVDDHQETAKLAAQWLSSLGHECESAFDGVSALEITRAFHPDAVLLDIGLPRMNGYDVAQQLRRDGFTGLLIAISGYGQPQDRKRSEEAGFDYHLVKPVDHDRVLRLLGCLTS